MNNKIIDRLRDYENVLYESISEPEQYKKCFMELRQIITDLTLSQGEPYGWMAKYSWLKIAPSYWEVKFDVYDFEEDAWHDYENTVQDETHKLEIFPVYTAPQSPQDMTCKLCGRGDVTVMTIVDEEPGKPVSVSYQISCKHCETNWDIMTAQSPQGVDKETKFRFYIQDVDNEEGFLITDEYSIMDLLTEPMDLEKIYEAHEPECTSSSCHTETFNGCDCPSVFDRAYVAKIIFSGDPSPAPNTELLRDIRAIIKENTSAIRFLNSYEKSYTESGVTSKLDLSTMISTFESLLNRIETVLKGNKEAREQKAVESCKKVQDSQKGRPDNKIDPQKAKEMYNHYIGDDNELGGK